MMKCRFLMVIALAALCGSCGKPQGDRVPIYPVHGSVTVNGQPAANAMVVFHSQNPAVRLNPHGRAQADGSFQVSTYELNDGAPAGEYIVTVVWCDPPPPGSSSDAPEGPDKLKGRYVNPRNSKLRVTVQEATNNQPKFELQ